MRKESDIMNMKVYESMCYSLAKAYTTGVRLYQDGTPLYYFSPYCIEPDPLGPFLSQIIDSGHDVGIITTSLYQFYAFLTLKPGLRLILGPTRALKDSGQEMEELLAILRIEEEKKNAYVRWLCSAPVINIQRLAWLLVSLVIMLQKRPFAIEEVWMESSPESIQNSVQIEYIGNRMNNIEDMGLSQAVEQSLSWEQLVCSYVENGQTDQLKELFSAPPKVYTGSIVYDELRQIKNRGIAMADSVSKAAIRGGLDVQQAFLTMELYIQKLELMQDCPTVERLFQEMVIDFAEQVEKLRCPADDKRHFCRMCIQYISRNVFAPIRTESMAKELGYSRSYLCSRFKQEMGLSITQYIQQEKIEEAKRLLRFSNYNLSEVASLLNFSSQSHFQTVFKRITGETPLEYRKKVKVIK